MGILSSLLLALLITSVQAQDITATRVDNTTLWVNAIVGKNGASTVECWGIQPPFVVSSQVSTTSLDSSVLSWGIRKLSKKQPGTVGNKILQLGQLSNASYTQFPPGKITDSG